ncbi:MAG TPA: thioredoxin domain-containing protein [Enteractinococcus helveticum]|uniref:Thioredoxin domain-containing protein n=1 Tax=Enteractinococcus helveticum TaxID=1837282 RepID=A0A921K8C0_9MICC|nr:thioredoxin domain-containing protein [Enteractinococcus helveticum]HJF13764.1 thioredoxin domain-containing protein [Enteractinococcus helveticum]
MSSNTSAARLWLTPTLVTLGIVVALIAAFFWGRSTASPQADAESDSVQQGTEQVEAVPDDLVDQVVRRDPEDPLAIGEVDAPVALVMFSDHQCPFCAQWNHETLPELMQYVDDGDLRIEWRDINMYGEDSVRAASAAVAAGQQGKFMDYHEQLFPEGDTLSDFSAEALTDLAEEAGLDMGQFQEDLESQETADIVAENEELGRSVGAQSTPTFLMNNTPIIGAQPASVFIDAFEKSLAAAQE